MKHIFKRRHRKTEQVYNSVISVSEKDYKDNERGSCHEEHLGWASATLEPSARTDLSGVPLKLGHE